MAKKASSGKASQRKSHAARHSVDKKPLGRRSTANPDRGQGPTRPEEEPANEGLPEEHYYGERFSRTPGNPGSLDEESRSPHAPYNRTYGQPEPDAG
jgi:hypothetical protein